MILVKIVNCNKCYSCVAKIIYSELQWKCSILKNRYRRIPLFSNKVTFLLNSLRNFYDIKFLSIYETTIK